MCWHAPAFAQYWNELSYLMKSFWHSSQFWSFDYLCDSKFYDGISMKQFVFFLFFSFVFIKWISIDVVADFFLSPFHQIDDVFFFFFSFFIRISMCCYAFLFVNFRAIHENNEESANRTRLKTNFRSSLFVCRSIVSWIPQ